MHSWSFTDARCKLTTYQNHKFIKELNVGNNQTVRCLAMEVLVGPATDLVRVLGEFCKRRVMVLSSAFLGICLAMLCSVDMTRTKANWYWSVMITQGNARWAIPLSLLTLLGNVALNERLRRLNYAVLEWSLFDKKFNVNMLPVVPKYYGWVYVAMLCFCLPFIVWCEERVFRYYGTNWLRGITIGMVGFAAAHLVGGVSVRMACCLAVVGGELVTIYMMMGGFGSVVLVHATTNFMFLAWIVYEVKLQAPLKHFMSTEQVKAQLPTIIGWYSSLKPALTRPSADA